MAHIPMLAGVVMGVGIQDTVFGGGCQFYAMVSSILEEND